MSFSLLPIKDSRPCCHPIRDCAHRASALPESPATPRWAPGDRRATLRIPATLAAHGLGRWARARARARPGGGAHRGSEGSPESTVPTPDLQNNKHPLSAPPPQDPDHESQPLPGTGERSALSPRGACRRDPYPGPPSPGRPGSLLVPDAAPRACAGSGGAGARRPGATIARATRWQAATDTARGRRPHAPPPAVRAGRADSYLPAGRAPAHADQEGLAAVGLLVVLQGLLAVPGHDSRRPSSRSLCEPTHAPRPRPGSLSSSQAQLVAAEVEAGPAATGARARGRPRWLSRRCRELSCARGGPWGLHPRQRSA